MGVYDIKQPNFVTRTAAVWSQKIAEGNRKRAPFDKVREQIETFLYSPHGFMWDDKYREKFKLRIEAAPKFPVTINAAFEALAVIAPYIYWQYADCKVSTVKPMEIVPEAYEGYETPEVQQFIQELQYERQQMVTRAEMTARILETLLNQMNRSAPNGGVVDEGRAIIADMLIAGMGVAWIEDDYAPGSSTKTAQFERGDISDLVIDPDCSDPLLKTATFCARRHITPYWQLERMWGRKPGTLKEFATVSSYEQKAHDVVSRASGERTQDYVVWYEIFSKCGFGFELSNARKLEMERFGYSALSPVEDEVNEIVGDFAYIALIPNHDIILNLNKPIMKMTAPEIKKAFAWPFPTYKANGEWPFELYRVYTQAKSPWAIPPLGPGLGHLIVISVLSAALVEKAWNNRREIIAVLEEYKKDLEKALSAPGSDVIISMAGGLSKPLEEAIQVLQRSPMNVDIYKVIEGEYEAWKRSSGLYDVLFAAQAGIERSAEGTKAKQQSASVRPDDMSERFAAFMSRCMTKQAWLAMDRLTPEDVDEALGPGGADMWERFVLTLTDAQKWRQISVEVTASDMKKPDRSRDMADLQAVMQPFLPVAQVFAQETGDWTPVDAMARQMSKTLNLKEEIRFVKPDPDPAQVELQQRGAEAEVAKTEAEANLKNAQAQTQGGDVEAEQAKTEMELAKGEQELQLERERMDMEREQAQFEMQVDAQKAQQDLEIKQVQSEQQLRQTAMKHRFDMQMSAVKGAQDVQNAQSMAKVKEKTAAKPATAKPASKG